MNDIENILQFIVEIEKLKNVIRKTKPVGLDRFENSAEHSWHVALSAIMLKDHSSEPINIDRVIKMLLIHDLGEIDAGDKIIYESETTEQKQKELDGIERLFAMLPSDLAKELTTLWIEFETGESTDAIYAKAIDRVPPLLHNMHGEGHSWKTHNIPKEKVYALNGERIAKASKPLWTVLESKLDDAVDKGLLK
ncbi:HD domain-containing protein [Aliivibrio kagoshimensis]|uniref:HD domain-containing protein n=1 Tax=Aliivibrio kagoshimensis TaxID=2910230 RepID=UPI003D0ECBEE